MTHEYSGYIAAAGGGQYIHVYWDEDDAWYAARVQQVHADGVMCMRYDEDYPDQPMRERTLWHNMHTTVWRAAL